MLTQTVKISSGDILSYSADIELTVKDLKDIINNVFTIRPRFRLHWLNEDETVKIDIPEDDILSGGSYNENYQNGQRRTLSISLFNSHKKYTPSINGIWEGTKFSFDMGLELDNNYVIWFNKGIFRVTSVGLNETNESQNVSLEMSDKFSLFESSSATLETTYSVPPGITIHDVITDILQLDKGNGEFFDTKDFIYDEKFKDIQTQATITQEAGSTYGSIILDLATQLSAEVFYDSSGHLNFVAINDVSADVDKPVIYQFLKSRGDFVNNSFSIDLNSIYNRVVVVGATVNSGICKAIAVNDDASSPLCYQRIGYKTAPIINDTNITSDYLAKERADYELRQKLVLTSSISQEVRYNPLLSVNNLISVVDDYFDFSEEKFLLQSISIPIDSSGTMSITASNIRNLPFTTTRR